MALGNEEGWRVKWVEALVAIWDLLVASDFLRVSIMNVTGKSWAICSQ